MFETKILTISFSGGEVTIFAAIPLHLVGGEAFFFLLFKDLKLSLRSGVMGVAFVPCHEGMSDVLPSGSFLFREAWVMNHF